jgi:hypothetical protein
VVHRIAGYAPSLGVGLVVVLAIGAAACSSTSGGRLIVTTASPAVETSSAGGTATPAATETPTAAVTGNASTPAPSSACSGSANIKDFYAAAAAKYSFAVYCPVALSSGWLVHSGSRDRASMAVVYYGPGSAAFTLSEGAFCTTSPAACQPCDTDEGLAPFGDRTGRLCEVGSGYAIYVDPGTAQAYRLQGTALSLDAFKAIAAGLVRLR